MKEREVSVFLYKGHEVIVYLEDSYTYAVDIRIDEYYGEVMQGYCELGSECDAMSVAKAFIDGLKHNENKGN